MIADISRRDVWNMRDPQCRQPLVIPLTIYLLSIGQNAAAEHLIISAL
jgi:hypothetical protein